MTDSTDDAEDYPNRSQTICQNPKHKGYEYLWLHECVDCDRELRTKSQAAIEDCTGRKTNDR
jgi:hypothetical protein